MKCKTHRIKMDDGICDECLKAEDARPCNNCPDSRGEVTIAAPCPCCKGGSPEMQARELFEVVTELIEWAEYMGGLESKVWKKAKAVANKARPK